MSIKIPISFPGFEDVADPLLAIARRDEIAEAMPAWVREPAVEPWESQKAVTNWELDIEFAYRHARENDRQEIGPCICANCNRVRGRFIWLMRRGLENDKETA